MFSSIGAWTNGWTNNRDVGDLIRHHTPYGVILMVIDETDLMNLSHLRHGESLNMIQPVMVNRGGSHFGTVEMSNILPQQCTTQFSQIWLCIRHGIKKIRWVLIGRVILKQCAFFRLKLPDTLLNVACPMTMGIKSWLTIPYLFCVIKWPCEPLKLLGVLIIPISSLRWYCQSVWLPWECRIYLFQILSERPRVCIASKARHEKLGMISQYYFHRNITYGTATMMSTNKTIHVNNITQHIEAETKWPPFRRRSFKCIFVNENILILVTISLRFNLK